MLYGSENSIIAASYANLKAHAHNTGVGSMGAPGAGVPMKFLSGTHTKS